MGLFDEKTRGRKSPDTVPLTSYKLVSTFYSFVFCVDFCMSVCEQTCALLYKS
jgi:hypothetical protein